MRRPHIAASQATPEVDDKTSSGSPLPPALANLPPALRLAASPRRMERLSTQRGLGEPAAAPPAATTPEAVKPAAGRPTATAAATARSTAAVGPPASGPPGDTQVAAASPAAKVTPAAAAATTTDRGPDPTTAAAATPPAAVEVTSAAAAAPPAVAPARRTAPPPLLSPRPTGPIDSAAWQAPAAGAEVEAPRRRDAGASPTPPPASTPEVSWLATSPDDEAGTAWSHLPVADLEPQGSRLSGLAALGAAVTERVQAGRQRLTARLEARLSRRASRQTTAAATASAAAAVAEPAAPPRPQPAPPPPSPAQATQPATHAVVPLGRWWLAVACDAALVVAIGAAAASLEMIYIGGNWPDDAPTLLDAVALWLHAYPNCGRHAVAVMLVASVAHTAWGARSGQTLGRRCVGLLSVQADGAPPSWAWAMVRALLALFSALAFGAGYYWAIVDPQRRGWHDLLCQSAPRRQNDEAGRPPRQRPGTGVFPASLARLWPGGRQRDGGL